MSQTSLFSGAPENSDICLTRAPIRIPSLLLSARPFSASNPGGQNTPRNLEQEGWGRFAISIFDHHGADSIPYIEYNNGRTWLSYFLQIFKIHILAHFYSKIIDENDSHQVRKFEEEIFNSLEVMRNFKKGKHTGKKPERG